MEESTEKLNELLSEYRFIERHLEETLLDKGMEKEYRDLIELINRIADYIFSDSGKAKKGIGDVMGGNVLELESDRLIRRGEERQSLKTARLMLEDGKLSLEEISRFSGLNLEKIEQLKKEEGL